MLYLLLLFPLAYTQKECFQGRVTGERCSEPSGQRFYFDATTKRCQPFYYKGCNGNDNRFATRQECMDRCSSAKETGLSSRKAVCPSGTFAAGATSLDAPTPCTDCPKNYTCEDNLCCPSKEYVCELQYDAGKFGANGKHTPRYYYNKSFKNCMLFTFYGREGNANNFATYNECKNFCMT